jgi:hypothetical protein
MKTSFFALGLLFIWGVGCGDDGTGGEGGTSSSSSVGTSGSSKATSGSGTGSSSASGTSASGTGSASTTTGASSASTGAGMADIDIALDSGDFFANCMPAVPPDPLSGSFIGTFTNAGPDTGTVTITSAELVFSNASDTMTWAFETMPSSFDLLNGANEQITFQKVANSGMGSNPNLGPCSFCGNDTMVALTVFFDDGTNLVEELIDIDGFICAF